MASDLDEAALVERLRAGDAAAFDVVYQAYRPRLFGFLVRLARRRDLAEDLLQETWIRLAKNARRLAPDTNLRAWLYTVARNLYLSHRRWVLIDLDRITASSAGVDPLTPFDLASASQTERRLEAALARLPLKYREVLLLVGVDGMDHAEAAAILELKPEALRQRLKRARGMLETALERATAPKVKESMA